MIVPFVMKVTVYDIQYIENFNGFFCIYLFFGIFKRDLEANKIGTGLQLSQDGLNLDDLLARIAQMIAQILECPQCG